MGQRYLNIHLHRGCWWRDNGSTSAHSFLIRGRDVGTQAVNKGDNILGMKDTLFLATDGSVGTLFSKDVGRRGLKASGLGTAYLTECGNVNWVHGLNGMWKCILKG